MRIFFLIAYPKANISEHISEQSKTKADPIAPNLSTNMILNKTAVAAPITEANNTALSFFSGIKACIMQTCAAPVKTTTGMIICIGRIAPS